MSRIAVVVFLAVAAVAGGRFVLDGSADGAAAELRGRVVYVVDGDTIKVSVGSRRESVRLIGIDTPESRRPGTPVECGAKAAARALRGLALTPDGRGRSVVLRTDPTQDRRDRYDRLLAYVDLVTGADVGEEMLRQGWAEPYVYQGRAFRRLGRYRLAQREARDAGRGVWRACGGQFHSG